jgi:predicted transcriptional regulator
MSYETESVKLIAPLTSVVAKLGRRRTADLLGCTPAALSKAIKAGRTVFVEELENETLRATEISCFPSR